ncbi:hypothetical protein M4D79_16320 [Mycolicibacterium novocastrense]|nr:hypothetical protein M4D79_16275 [Mycolicibacterium novocastrense]UUO00519.1 hypothetical protein M4D79_16320 [Mycolicibacterium novocastrense]
MHIVYIGSGPLGNDRVRCSDALTRHLSTRHELKLTGRIYEPNSQVLSGRSPDRAWSADELDVVDVVYMEGGWNDDEDRPRRWRGDRFPLELAKWFVHRGGQLIVSDVSQMYYSNQRHHLRKQQSYLARL